MSNIIQNLSATIAQFEKSIPDLIAKVIVDNQEFIIDMNAESQLYDKGINRFGVDISDYAPYSPITIEIKREKGQPYNRVTLRDEGKFESSFFIEFLNDGFRISASDAKTAALTRKYGDGILGLTDENLQVVIGDYIKPFIFEQARKTILRR